MLGSGDLEINLAPVVEDRGIHCLVKGERASAGCTDKCITVDTIGVKALSETEGGIKKTRPFYERALKSYKGCALLVLQNPILILDVQMLGGNENGHSYSSSYLLNQEQNGVRGSFFHISRFA